MISDTRRKDLYNQWLEETADEDGDEWREDLTQEEADLIAEWDEDFPL